MSCSKSARRGLAGSTSQGCWAGSSRTTIFSPACCLFALNVVFYVAALARLNLSTAYPIMVAGGTVIVVGVSIFALREALTPLQMLGLALLVVGIALVGQRSFV